MKRQSEGWQPWFKSGIRLIKTRLWLRLAISFGSAFLLALLIWFAAPLLSFGSFQPFEDAGPRLTIILLIFLAVGGAEAYRFYIRKQGAEQIARTMGADDSDAPVLAERMKEALATLRDVSGASGNYLYDLPWYVLIGPPGSGKTTALVNSGLEFPLAQGATPGAVSGVGGTRYCDWWFTDDAVLIDTAGRYTTQDSDAKADQKSWFAFLDLLKRSRPRQPINGVIVAISLEDILTSNAKELAAHADAIRARLLELHNRLKVDFPVYALFTKADLVIGFMEYFNDLGEGARRQVWGSTFQTSDKTRNMIGAVPGEFDALITRLNQSLPEKLENEKDPTSRVLLFGFPAQMSALRQPIANFLDQIFDPVRYPVNAALRGFYFTSGTQQGTPIDQLLGALSKNFGAQGVAAPTFSGQGKSFFLTDLIKIVIIGEAGWVTRVRANSLMTAAAYAALLAVVPLIIGAWWVSYAHNNDMITQSQDASSRYKTLASGLSQTNTVSDRDFGKILPPLHALRFMPGGYQDHTTPVISYAGFGLAQSARLRSAAETAYQIGLERLLRPRLIYRLEEQLEANANDPKFLYEALKVYLMLGGLKTVDRPLLIGWMERDWSENLYAGPKNADGRKELEQHLVAMLDLDNGRNSFVSLNGPLVERSQATLARIDPAQRAYELLEDRAKSALIDDWIASKNAGAGALVVFDDSLDRFHIPYFFTHAGFEHAFIGQLMAMRTEMNRNRWILGRFGEQPVVADQYERLLPDLVDIYTKNFVAAWQEDIAKVQIRRLTEDRPTYPLLTAAAAVTSPIARLLEAIHDETSLHDVPQSLGDSASNTPNGAAAALVGSSGESPAKMVDKALRPYQLLVEGNSGRRPIDLILSDLNDIRSNLNRLATNTSQADQLSSRLDAEVSKLKNDTDRMPPPFAMMMDTTANDVTREIADSASARRVQVLRDKVTFSCQETIASRYPFSANAEQEVTLADFRRMFGPKGLLDQFATETIIPAADTSGSDWKWHEDAPISRQLSPTALSDFQKAAAIRDSFFADGPTPGFTVAVTPPPTTGVKLEIDSTAIYARGNTASTTVQWPGSSEPHRAVLGVEMPGGRPPLTIEKTGVWALYRVLDTGQVTPDGTLASFTLAGREFKFRFTPNNGTKPLALSLLRSFHCPSGT
jgi:type VI secretion system protein ImpL